MRLLPQGAVKPGGAWAEAAPFRPTGPPEGDDWDQPASWEAAVPTGPTLGSQGAGPEEEEEEEEEDKARSRARAARQLGAPRR